MSLTETIRQTTQTLVAPGSRLVAGVSGGADSMALLHLLHHQGDYALHVGTLDHGLRGEAGAADARFVVQTCTAWGIPVTAGRRDDLSAERDVENAARKARYDFLANVARETGAHHIAVAHHADDQAETVLLHLLRGTGLDGLAGMAASAPLPGHPDLTLIRPLLHISRQEIEAYCREHTLPFRQDATNDDTRLLRNRIRRETLPHLRQMNPQIDRALIRLADSAALDMEFIQRQLEWAAAGNVAADSRRVTLKRRAFDTLHPALRRHFIRWSVHQVGGRELDHDHIVAAVDLALRGDTGQQSLFPGGVRLRLDYEHVVIERADAPPAYDGPLLSPGQVIPASVPGNTAVPGSEWILCASEQPFDEAAASQARLVIPSETNIELRTRRPGDRFKPLGLNGHTQSLKEWMIDHKIARAIRDQVPVLTVQGEIAALMVANQWIVADPFAVRHPQQRIIHFRFMRQARM